MARFPKAESEVIALAQAMIAGLSANSTIFPSPPVLTKDLTTRLNNYLAAQNAAIAAIAAAQQATAVKDEALQELVDDMKADLRYAENTVDFNDEKLKMLGWGGRAERTSLQPPGQVRTLEAARQGEGWVFLDWKEPVDGGKVAAYKVQRRPRNTEIWQDIATAIDSEVTLVDQPRGQALEYRIIAINKAGEGAPSNTVPVVL